MKGKEKIPLQEKGTVNEGRRPTSSIGPSPVRNSLEVQREEFFGGWKGGPKI